VTRPKARDTIDTMAKCTGFMSTEAASGCSTVPTITIAGMASRKQPTTRKTKAMKKPTPIGPMPQPATLASSSCGMR